MAPRTHFTFDGVDKVDLSKSLFVRGLKQVNRFKIPILVPLTLACIWIANQATDETDKVCFENLGCFPIGPPWSERPAVFHFVPQSPYAVRTRFKIFSKEYKSGSKEFSSFEFRPREYNVNWSRDLHVIVHGFMDDTSTWATQIKDAILLSKDYDCNVILVDWRQGAKMYYPQVVANTRIVAAELSKMLTVLGTQTKMIRGNVHIIGHSLGSHIASYVGKQLTDIGKITALDPASTLFEGYHSDVLLNSSDAKIVQVFHSNIGPFGFGLRAPVGTIDIYLNNGRDQPGCKKMEEILKKPLTVDGIAGNIQDEIACSHRRAYEVYKELIKNNGMKMFPLLKPTLLWTSYNISHSNYLENIGDQCHVVNFSSASKGAFYLPTSAEPPYFMASVSIFAWTCAFQDPLRNVRLEMYFCHQNFTLFFSEIHPLKKIWHQINANCKDLEQESLESVVLRFTVLLEEESQNDILVPVQPQPVLCMGPLQMTVFRNTNNCQNKSTNISKLQLQHLLPYRLNF